VLLMHGERSDGHAQYMYEPPMRSLKAGFEAFSASLAQPSRYDVVVPDFKTNNHSQVMFQVDELQSGDIFVWLGQIESNLFTGSLDGIGNLHADMSSLETRRVFRTLMQRDVHVIYYQSEPAWAVGNGCAIKHGDVDEMWDFSWANIEACESAGGGPKQRYVPLAALSTPKTLHNAQAGPLLFFGDVLPRQGCWNQLKSQLHDNLRNEYGAWDDTAYQNVLKHYSIYLNIHKTCGQPNQPITWRNAKLLNAHALIVSERCHPRDEQEYAGIIDFVDLGAIPAKYNELANLSQEERQELADSRAKTFSARFDPRTIFQKAGIYDLMTTRLQ